MIAWDRGLLALSTGVLVALKWYPWYLAQIYHADRSHLTLVAWVSAVAVTVCALCFWAARYRFGVFGVRLLWWIVLVSTVYYPIKLHTFGATSLPLSFKVVLAASLLALGVVFAVSGSAESWLRASRISIVGAFIYLLAPLLLVPRLNAEERIILSLADGPVPVAEHSVPNRLIVVLDETSFEHANQLQQAFVGPAGTTVKSRPVAAAGKDTMNAIPSMLSPRLYEGLAPCSATALCDATRMFDFSKLAAADNTTDIVGIYHPYCAIASLRFCFRSPMFAPLTLRHMFCFDPFRLKLHAHLELCATPQSSFDSGLSELVEQAWGAPFWRGGGTLLLHLPLPHPSGSGMRGGLSKEYLENVNAAEKFLRQAFGRLNSRFGSNYVMLVTSDHGLRLNMWCNQRAYQQTDCQGMMQEKSALVPLIVVSGEPARIGELPGSNLGLFSGPTRQATRESGLTKD